MTPQPKPEPEPRPLREIVPFEEGDFHVLSEGLSKDPQYNDRRLATRRKLGALGKEAVRRAAEGEGGIELLSRTSLHHPTTFNGMRVRRLWTYLCRGKRAKTKLRRILGAELAKDLDAAYRNAYLCIAIESDALEVALRIHKDAWYDGQNLVNRVEREGPDGWLERLNATPGYRLRLDDWKGEWRCGELDRDRIAEFLRYYKPGDHSLTVERRWPAPVGARGGVLGEGVPGALLGEIEALVPLFRFSAWSEESDFLLSS